MAGSITWRRYTADNGNVYSVKVDKSNANILAFPISVLLCNVRTGDFPCLPPNISPRKIYAYLSGSPSVRRTFIVGNLVAISNNQFNYGGNFLFEPAPINNIWIITGYVGERVTNMPTYFNQGDTGLNDGTVGQ